MTGLGGPIGRSSEPRPCTNTQSGRAVGGPRMGRNGGKQAMSSPDRHEGQGRGGHGVRGKGVGAGTAGSARSLDEAGTAEVGAVTAGALA